MKKTLIALALTVAAGPALAADETEVAKFSYSHKAECGIQLGRADAAGLWIGKAQGDSEDTAMPVTFVNNTKKGPNSGKVTVEYHGQNFKITGNSHISPSMDVDLYFGEAGTLIGSTPKPQETNILFRGSQFKILGDYNWNKEYLLQPHIKSFEKSAMEGNTKVTGEIVLKIDC